MMWQEALVIARQLANDSKRDPGCAYARCFVKEVTVVEGRDAVSSTDWYWHSWRKSIWPSC